MEDIVSRLGLRALCRVIPISKKHLIAMDKTKPPMSGAGEGLDQLLVRELNREPFDAAVVAWDLYPIWNPTTEECRWQETLDFYRLLAASTALPVPWQAQAQRRWEDLSGRELPNQRIAPPRLTNYSVLALCMDPVFEGILTQDEAAIRAALGVSGQRLVGWPADWRGGQSPRPDQDLLQPAIVSARRLRPPPAVVVKLRGDMKTAKDAWGSYLLSYLLGREASSAQVLAHPTLVRLRELLTL